MNFKSIFKIAVPIMIGNVINQIQMLIDKAFLGQVNELYLSSLGNVSTPMWASMSVCFSIVTGASIIISQKVGAKDTKDVEKYASSLLLWSNVFPIFLFFVWHFFGQQIFIALGTKGIVLDFCMDYLKYFKPIILLIGLEASTMVIMQTSNHTKPMLFFGIIRAGLNVILDYILIFGKFGFQPMGIKGAAWATVIGQIIGALISVILNIKINKEINFNPKGFKPQSKIIIDIYKVGIPSILLGSIGSVLTYLLNLILGAFSTVAIAVYGVYFKLQSFVFMPVFGLNNGIVPIVAYNFGAKYKKRIIDSIKMCALVALIIMGVGTLIFEVFPTQLLAMFSPNEEMLEIGIPALRIIAIHFPIAAIGITFTSVFQAFGRGFLSMCVSFIRQIFALLPSAWLLSLTGNINNIWWAFVIAELFSLLACIFAMKNVYKTQIKQL